MKPNPHRLAGRDTAVLRPAPAPKPRAFTGLAGSPLAQFERAVQTLTNTPIPFDASALHDGRTIDLPLPLLEKKTVRKLRAAVRAAKWRKDRDTPEFKAARAKAVKQRRADVREETKRVGEVEAILQANPAPLFVMKDAPHGKGLLETGGYDTDKITEVSDTRESTTGKVKDTGYGALDGETELDDEFDDTFVERAFLRSPNSKEVRMLHRLVHEATFTKKGSRVLYCLKCKDEVSPRLSPAQDVELTFLHIFYQHHELFETWLKRLNNTGCPEDHEALVTRHSGGELPLQCRRCDMVLWRPPRVRTHTSREPDLGGSKQS
jgi:hypothetical protein